MRINLLGIMLLISFMGQLKSEEVIITHTSSNTFDETPALDYNLATQEFTIDFGEVDEISSGRVVIHDDSGGYQVKNFLVTPACHEFTFICPLQGTLYITITTPHGDTYAGTTGN